MKYTVNAETYGDISLESTGKDVLLTINNDQEELPENQGVRYVSLSYDELKEFRRALGYVWQEVENHNG